MRCPFCGHEDTQVKDSRSSEDGSSIKRRRICPNCNSRFTTFERIQIREISVVKKDGRKKPFDRDKLARSMYLALRKRDVKEDEIEQAVNNIVKKLEASGEAEISSQKIGQIVMDKLALIDQVAYVRFASVYREFREAKDFEEFIDNIGNKKNIL